MFLSQDQSFRLHPVSTTACQHREGSVALNYSIEAIRYSGLDRNDTESNNLSLVSSFDHSPGKWRSQIVGSARQTVTNVDDRLGVSDNLLNDNRSEVRQLSATTLLTDRISKTLQYQSSVGVDIADVEGGDSSEGANVNLGLNNFLSRDAFTWSTSLASQIARSDSREQQIDNLTVNLNYRINTRWQLFADFNTSETDDSEFDQQSTLVGFNWRPSSNASVRLGVGEREDTETYTFDAVINGRKTTFTASYSEQITSGRSIGLTELFEDVPDELASESISIDPVLQQRADVGLTFRGRRSTLSFTLFDDSRDQGGALPEEKSEGLTINFNRQLSAKSDTSVIVTGQKTRFVETIESSSVEGGYNYRPTRNSTVSGSLAVETQHAETEQQELDQILAKITFAISW